MNKLNRNPGREKSQEVIYETKPSFFYFVTARFLGLLALLCVVVSLTTYFGQIHAALIIATSSGCGMKLHFNSLRYQITRTCLVKISRVYLIFPKKVYVMLGQISSVEVLPAGFLDGVFGISEVVVFESSGQSQIFQFMSNPEEFKTMLTNEREKPTQIIVYERSEQNKHEPNNAPEVSANRRLRKLNQPTPSRVNGSAAQVNGRPGKARNGGLPTLPVKLPLNPSGRPQKPWPYISDETNNR